MTAAGEDSVRRVAARTWAALVHHPVYDRSRRVVTTAVTNLDIHDIARSACTFGLAGYLVVTPIAAQRELAERILGHWREELELLTGGRAAAGEAAPGHAGAGTSGAGAREDEFRGHALARVEVVASIEEAVALVARRCQGQEPLVVATSARSRPGAIDPRTLLAEAERAPRPLLLLFGTGWGLADQVLDRVHHLLTPIRGQSDYNHLSVRSAAAIVLDRLFGDRLDGPPENHLSRELKEP
ncbi:MAG TPA: RNA methyltransferase [Polyangia bacterium]|nr:RNA methyltransferase [Polyangia bacterium]